MSPADHETTGSPGTKGSLSPSEESAPDQRKDNHQCLATRAGARPIPKASSRQLEKALSSGTSPILSKLQ